MSDHIKVKCSNCGHINSKRRKKEEIIHQFKCNSCQKLISKKYINKAIGIRSSKRILGSLNS